MDWTKTFLVGLIATSNINSPCLYQQCHGKSEKSDINLTIPMEYSADTNIKDVKIMERKDIERLAKIEEKVNYHDDILKSINEKLSLLESIDKRLASVETDLRNIKENTQEMREKLDDLSDKVSFIRGAGWILIVLVLGPALKFIFSDFLPYIASLIK